VNIWCDESGGVGRGAMTLAAVAIPTEEAEAMLASFRETTGLTREMKGSRIDLDERRHFYELFAATSGRAIVSVAISAVIPSPGQDRGDHDRDIYAALLEDAVGTLTAQEVGCTSLVIDDGRYDPKTLAKIREHVAGLVGPLGLATLELSHKAAGLQIADVIANSFFNRAMVSKRQGVIAAMVEPFLESGQIIMRVIGRSDETA
jgi:hypothetical protein